MKTTKIYTVKFRVKLSEGVSKSDILDWLAYRLGATGCLSEGNPLCDEDIEAIPYSVDAK